jgi:hypothetical protein
LYQGKTVERRRRKAAKLTRFSKSATLVGPPKVRQAAPFGDHAAPLCTYSSEVNNATLLVCPLLEAQMKDNSTLLNEIVEIEQLEKKAAPSAQWDPVE